MIHIGTSGYSYQDWIGPFYPQDIEKGEMLPFYALHFDITEINSTYYQMPNVFAVRQWGNKTPESFGFIVKAHGSMTHTRDANREDFRKFMDALEPLHERGKLRSLLFQFPFSFHYNTKEMDYLKRIRDYLPNENILVEYRNHRWVCQDTFDIMKRLNFGFVCVDEPDLHGLLKPVVVATNAIGYIRFHGRNATQWYNHKKSYERYNYLYSEEELREWVPKVRTLSKYTNELYITFNNHFRSQGVINGKMMQALLKL